MRSERIRRHCRLGTEGPIGSPGNAHWSIVKAYAYDDKGNETSHEYRLFHLGTHMLTWEVDRAGKRHALYMSTGWGSVTDQQIMNAVFDELKLPYYYSRRNGAHIDRKAT